MKRWLSLVRRILIDLLVFGSLGLAIGRSYGDENMKGDFIATVGPAVHDQRIDLGDSPSVHDKVDIQGLEDTVGGGCLNTSRAVRHMGVAHVPITLVGDDDHGRQLSKMLKAEFPSAITVPLMQRTRRTVIVGDTLYCLRSAMKTGDMPGQALHTVNKAKLTIVSPMTARDAPLVAQILTNSKQSVLQLSKSQLRDAETAARLSRAATWTVINRSELESWTGCVSLEAGLMILQGLGVQNLLVTDSNGVAILHRGKRDFQPSFKVTVDQSTVGAGDCFTGTFAAALTAGRPYRQAIELGQAAAALHLSGALPNDSAADIAAAVETLPQELDLPELPFRRRQAVNRTPLMAGIAISASLLLTSILSFGL